MWLKCLDDYFDRNPLAYYVLLSQLCAATLVGFDGLVPMTAGAKIISLGFAVVGTSIAAGVWAHWLRKNPPYIPFVMDFPSGWNAHRPLILIVWVGVAAYYGIEFAKLFNQY